MSIIVVRISTRTYIHSLSCIAPILVEILEASDRWVVSDVWAGVSSGLRSIERSDETNQNSHASLTALASQGFKAFRDSST
jgi:hypothetical protein